MERGGERRRSVWDGCGRRVKATVQEGRKVVEREEVQKRRNRTREKRKGL